jgi:glucokinase
MRIGIDIGGSAVKIGALVGDRTIVARSRLPISREIGFEALIGEISRACADIERLAATRATAIGVACPGYCDRASGRIIDGAANVPCLRGRNPALALTRSLDRPVVCGNDGVAAALGEMMLGAGRSLRSFAMVTLGTGVGGAVVLDGRIITGPNGQPPELGAIVLELADPPGTLERYASSQGFVEAYRGAGGEDGTASGADIAARAADDRVAEAAAEVVAQRIAQACGGLVNALNLEACLLGGGLVQACPSLPVRVARHLPRYTWPFLMRGLRVMASETGADAGLIGAACLISQEARRAVALS